MIDIITWSELCDLMKKFYYPKKRLEVERVVPLRLECGEGEMEIFNNTDEKVFSLTREEYEECIHSLGLVGSSNDSDLFWKSSCEIHTRVHSRFVGAASRLFSEEPILDKENGLVYEFGEPSLTYVLYKISYFESSGQRPRSLLDQPTALRMGAARSKLIGPGESSVYFIPYGGSKTLRIAADKARSHEAFYDFANSFFFQMAYAFDVAVMPSHGFDYLLRSGRFVRLRRGGSDATMEAPLRSYNKILVHNYQLAIAAENPFLEFVSYYQIMEHFFEQVFSEHVVNMARDEISSPAFSLKRKTDIQSLVKKIERAGRQRREDGGGNEAKALALVLAKYVDLDKLKDDVMKVEGSLVEYYENSIVPFSKGAVIPFSGGDKKKTLDGMAKRIYDTRNALVHAKEGSKPRFLPFRDDGDLAREIPLVRLIAEQILIGEGDLLR
ncbi:hypothetical protein AB0M72_23985 [Nocardiopsis dassonvillei]